MIIELAIISNRLRCVAIISAAVAFCLLYSGGSPAFGGAATSSEVDSAASRIGKGDIELRGRVICIPEEMHRLHQADLPTDHAHLYGFMTADGDLFTLLRTKNSEAFFADERIRQKELIVRGRVFPKTSILDATPLRTVRDGVVYDLYYYCDICVIKTVVPGECMCCQKPVVLMETLPGSLDNVHPK